MPSLQAKTHQSRLEIIDFLRGIAIIEMLAAHYVGYFPRIVGKFVDYTETAMALFVLLAGFMVGWGLRKFVHNPADQTSVLWQRGLRVLAVQYVIILSVGVPLYLIGMPGIGGNQSLGTFILTSAAFLNQIGLIHILPTFIPLFAISPAILWALSKGYDVAVLVASVGLFTVGHYDPYILDLGEPTIFPFVLFQLYFVIGCLVGKHAQVSGSLAPRHPGTWLAASAALLVVTMVMIHGKVIPGRLFSTHPLNWIGLIYHAPIIVTLCFASIFYWEKIQRMLVYPFIVRFGRHALLAFVIHLYLAKILGVANFLLLVPPMLNWALVGVSVYLIGEILKYYESSLRSAEVPVWARTVHVLFK